MGILSRPLARCLLLLAALATVCGCATSPVASIERNPDLSLASVRTFGWFDPLGTDRAAYESFVTARLKRAVAGVLERRGLAYRADAPDVLVNFYVNLEDRQEVRQVLAPPGAVRGTPWSSYYYGYRTGLYDPWPAYELAVSEYQQGTLTVDVVDEETGTLAWSGVLEGRVRERTLTEQDEALREALDALFARFP